MYDGLPQPGRNDECWCGSGRKYKKCHLSIDDKLESLHNQGLEVPPRSLLKSAADIEGVRRSAAVNVGALDYVAERIGPGCTTEDINTWVHEFTVAAGAIPAPLDYEGFPKSVCTSVNEVVCHGIPAADQVLREGDIWSKVETEEGNIGYIKNLYIDGIGDEYAEGTDYYDGGVTMYTTGSVNFRAGASTDTAAMGTFAKGTKLTALGENGRFYLVKDATGRQGFVSSLYLSRKYVAPAGSSSASRYETGIITGNTVNVRKGGGMSYSVIAKVYGGDEVEIIYEGNYWTKIETPKGVIGWVNNNYIR